MEPERHGTRLIKKYQLNHCNRWALLMDGPTHLAGGVFYIHGEVVPPKEAGRKRHLYLYGFMTICY